VPLPLFFLVVGETDVKGLFDFFHSFLIMCKLFAGDLGMVLAEGVFVAARELNEELFVLLSLGLNFILTGIHAIIFK